jgi:hypothetical protein
MRLAATLAEHREQAFLFRTLATLRTDAPVGDDVTEWKWNGPTDQFRDTARSIGDAGLFDRAEHLARRR